MPGHPVTRVHDRSTVYDLVRSAVSLAGSQGRSCPQDPFQFVHDNNSTVEFDAFGLSAKDFMTHQVLLRNIDPTERLKTTRDRQKSYADKRRKPLEFKVGDHVMLKVAPLKGVVRFGKKWKLTPRFVGHFEITERIGKVAYRLRLPQELNNVHETFHVSNLKKCLADPTLQVPLEEIQVDERLNFMEEPIEILEREFKKLKRSRIAIVKVRWNLKRGPEFTWEREDQMKLKYPRY
ncbi:hypothetical protein Tco_1546421 [Tanacetum coccineum]